MVCLFVMVYIHTKVFYANEIDMVICVTDIDHEKIILSMVWRSYKLYHMTSLLILWVWMWACGNLRSQN